MKTLTREEFQALPKEEIMKAVRIIEFLVADESQMSSYYLEGDSDTQILATEYVALRHGYDPKNIDMAAVFEKHRLEVITETRRLIEQGQKDKEFFKRLEKYLGSIFLYYRRH